MSRSNLKTSAIFIKFQSFSALAILSYRRIFVYTFWLINICLSLSDDANKIKTLNIERAYQFKFSLKISVQFIEWFRTNSLLKTPNFIGDVRLINFLPPSNFAVFDV